MAPSLRIARAGFAVLLLLSACGCSTTPTVWRFDRLNTVGGVAAHAEGQPQIIETPAGKAVHFNGVSDALFVDANPLADASTFTAEAVFRPDGGAFEQRWMHLAEQDPATGKDTGARLMFEIRVVGERWYLDAFAAGNGFRQTLAATDKTFPIGRWYAVAMTFDGNVFRSYVDGVAQMEQPIAFEPLRGGHSSFGTRIDRRNYFNGAVFEARFTPRALPSGELLSVPAMLNAADK